MAVTPVLDAAAAHVWSADLDAFADARFDALLSSLDDEEIARARRFHFEHDRRRFSTARGLLRLLLARYLDAPPAAIRLDYGPRGKPTVAAPATRLRFNLSHSHGRALFAFALDRPVGIDLEAGARLGDDWLGLTRRIFSPRERAELAALPPGVQRAAFLNGWTRKEAYLKATGQGIADGLQGIEVTLSPDAPAALLAAPGGLDWTLHDLRVDADYAAALLIGGVGSVSVHHFDCTMAL